MCPITVVKTRMEYSGPDAVREGGGRGAGRGGGA